MRELARQVPCNPGHISNLKNGRARPSPELALALDRALAADGQLVAAWEASRQPIPASPLASIAPDADLYGRITRAADEPLRIDVPVVEWLEHTLAEHRRVEDSVGARPLLGLAVAVVPRLPALFTSGGRPWRDLGAEGGDGLLVVVAGSGEAAAGSAEPGPSGLVAGQCPGDGGGERGRVPGLGGVASQAVNKEWERHIQTVTRSLYGIATDLVGLGAEIPRPLRAVAPASLRQVAGRLWQGGGLSAGDGLRSRRRSARG